MSSNDKFGVRTETSTGQAMDASSKAEDIAKLVPAQNVDGKWDENTAGKQTVASDTDREIEAKKQAEAVDAGLPVNGKENK